MPTHQAAMHMKPGERLLLAQLKSARALQQRVSEELAKHAVEKAKRRAKQALKEAEQGPERLAERAEKKTKGIFEDLKQRVGH